MQYGKMTPETMLFFSSTITGDNLPIWVQVYCYSVAYWKNPCKLNDREYYKLENWITENGIECDFENVLTLQISIEELAKLIQCRKETAQKAIKTLIKKGLLQVVSSGTRGVSTLYVVMPLPTNAYTSYEEKSIHNRFGNYEETTEPITATNNIKGFGNYEETTEPNEQQRTQKCSVNLKKGSVNTTNRYTSYEEKSIPNGQQIGIPSNEIGIPSNEIGIPNQQIGIPPHEGAPDQSIIIHTNPNNPYLLIEEKNESAKKSERFTPYEVPTLEQVKNYCNEKGLNINPHSFFYHYAKSGWTANGQQVLDWRKLAEKFQQTESETEMTIESKPVYIAVCPHCVKDFNDSNPQRFTKNNATGKWQCSRFQSFTERELQKIIKQQDGKK